jgi:hypothetical protein
MTLSYAQEIKQVSQISVTGRVKVIPDQATITATVQTKGIMLGSKKKRK